MKLEQTGPLAPIDEPWTLIRDAISDLNLQEKLKSIRIDMNNWHFYEDRECRQCLAGCVMSRRLGADTTQDICPDDFSSDDERRLQALDLFRCGEVRSAYYQLLLDLPYPMPDSVAIPMYGDDPDGFKFEMLALADLLEKA